MAAVFHYAVIEGDVTKVRFLMKYSPALRVDSVNQYGLTALQQSSLNGNVEMVNFLLEKGADLSCVDSNGRTALHLASQEGHLGVVSLLVTSACANVNAKTKQGKKAIDLAQTDQVRALLSQAMLTESFKRKCSLEDEEDLDASYVGEYRNIPGCRNSLSSASTDSGVYDDSSSSQDGSNDLKFYRGVHNRVSNLRGYHSASSGHSVISEDSGLSDVSEDRYQSRFQNTNSRRLGNINSPVSSLRKSNLYSDKIGLESARDTKEIEKDKGIESAGAEALRYRRPEKSYVRDMSRRRTVTFGITEKERETDRAESSVRYCGSSNNQNPIPKPQEGSTNSKQKVYSKTPPPVPPRVPLRPSPAPRSSSLKFKVETDQEPAFRPRPVPRRPRTEFDGERGSLNRRSFHAGFTQRGIN